MKKSAKKGKRRNQTRDQGRGQDKNLHGARGGSHPPPIRDQQNNFRNKTSEPRFSDSANNSNSKGLVEGIVKRNPDGFGFLLPDDPHHLDVYIPKHSMVGIMTNDRVQVRVDPRSKKDRLSGEISKVIHHAVTKVVGEYQRLTDISGVILDHDGRWGSDLYIEKNQTKGAKAGQLVVISISTYPGTQEGFTGKVAEVLGEATDPSVDAKRVLHSHGVPMEFSPQTLMEAKQFPKTVTERDLASRRDLRDLPFVTIDGQTAKDFDDAICVESDHDGFLLWVAIADVSHYVKQKTAMDTDAFERGNSTYFPHFVVPMLPEELSNELCSLKPHVDRLAFTAEMKISFNGKILQSTFYESVIKSRHRITYGEAQEVIDGSPPEKLLDVQKMVLKATDLAKILMAKRFREGSLDLSIPETQIILDDSGEPTDIIRSTRLFSHRLIEELMLVTNIAVAEFLNKMEVPAIFRIHDKPAPDLLKNLENFLVNFGSKVKSLSGAGLQQKITSSLEVFAGRPEYQILNILTLRSMKQAEYSPHNIGHFGLGFENYTHFTSPIRRYADLIVHRLLKSIVVKNGPYKKYSDEDLATAGTNLSACEQRSTKSERQFQSIKKARFISKFLGQEFEGIISSVTRFGIFVLLKNYDVDGLVKLEALGRDKFEFDEERLRLVGARSKLVYKIGDQVKIQVVKTNIDMGQIDFGLAEKPAPNALAFSQQAYDQTIRQKLTQFDKPHFKSEKLHFGKQKKTKRGHKRK